jgi:hypothetical protein
VALFIRAKAEATLLPLPCGATRFLGYFR